MDSPRPLISQGECLPLLGKIRQQGLTGGAIFYDAQVYNSERLVLAFLHSAVKAGAKLANYLEVSGFLKERDRVIGVQATDFLTGTQFDIRARMVVCTCGPWVNRVLGLLKDLSGPSCSPFRKSLQPCHPSTLPHICAGHFW